MLVRDGAGFLLFLPTSGVQQHGSRVWISSSATTVVGAVVGGDGPGCTICCGFCDVDGLD